MGLLKKFFTNCTHPKGRMGRLKALLDDVGFAQTEIHRKKPMYATILGVKP